MRSPCKRRSLAATFFPSRCEATHAGEEYTRGRAHPRRTHILFSNLVRAVSNELNQNSKKKMHDITSLCLYPATVFSFPFIRSAETDGARRRVVPCSIFFFFLRARKERLFSSKSASALCRNEAPVRLLAISARRPLNIKMTPKWWAGRTRVFLDEPRVPDAPAK